VARPSFLTPRLAIASLLAVVITIVGAFVADLTITGAADSAGTPSSSAADEPGTGDGPAIRIDTFEFDPDRLEVAAGTVVSIDNRDATTHTLTSGVPDAPDGEFDVEVGGGGTAELQVDDAATYAYFCAIHPDMVGRLEVTP
jgi:plastocyanin